MSTPKRSRYSIDLSQEYRDRLARLAKAFGITQGEAIETMIAALNQMPDEQQPAIDALFKAKREEKVARRAPDKQLYKQFRDMTPEQRAAAIAAAARVEQK